MTYLPTYPSDPMKMGSGLYEKGYLTTILLVYNKEGAW